MKEHPEESQAQAEAQVAADEISAGLTMRESKLREHHNCGGAAWHHGRDEKKRGEPKEVLRVD